MSIIDLITCYDNKVTISEIFRYIMFCDECDTINLLSFDKQFLPNLSLMIVDFNLDQWVVNLILAKLYNSPNERYHGYANAIANNVWGNSYGK